MSFGAPTVRKQRALVPHQSPNSGAFRVGQKVTVVRNLGRLENATIRFIGETKFYSGVTWYGVELEGRTGKNNGSVHGERYFRCPVDHGLFVRREMISHAGWGRQATSRSPFEADHRQLMPSTRGRGDGSDDDYDSRASGRQRGMWAVDDGGAAALSSQAATSDRVRSLFGSQKEESRQRILDKAQSQKKRVAYFANVPVEQTTKGLFKGLDSDQAAHKDALLQYQKPSTRAWYHETDPSLIGIGQQLEQLERIHQSLLRRNLPRTEKLKALQDWAGRASQLKVDAHERLRAINELLHRLPEAVGGIKSYAPPTIIKTTTKAPRRRQRADSSDEEEGEETAGGAAEESSSAEEESADEGGGGGGGEDSSEEGASD